MATEDNVQKLFFVVVEFVEETDEHGSIPMAVVSTKWLRYKKDCVECFWPTYLRTDNERIKAVKEHADLWIEKCGTSLVNAKYHSSSYEKALAKLKHLEDLSSVSQSSDNDEAINSKRVIRDTKSIDEFQYSSGSEELDVQLPPKFVHDNHIVSSNVHTQKKHVSSYSNRKQPRTYNDSNKTAPCDTDTPIQIRTENNTQCTNCRTNERLINQMMKSLELLSQDVKYLIQLNKNSIADDPYLNPNPVFEELLVTTVEKLIALNHSLQDDTVMASMCTSMQIVEGKDVVDTTRRIMCHIMKTSVAIKYNWSGRNGKKSFEALTNISKLIVVVVRKNPLSRNSTQQEIEAVIKVWLRNAPDRDGGRMNRKGTKTGNTGEL
ncbi:hypothetical protein RI129_003059 [Pyrocoelia pectoralis]|uniref:DUF4806 domain-containing protein n=1 Tax=Pyrocoelia pectoralis TaxID=417401 RepID=A0AAN7ZMD3_9COLE